VVVGVIGVAVGVTGVGVGVIPIGSTAAAESKPAKIIPVATAMIAITVKIRLFFCMVISPGLSTLH
jgi:hypothetical protein